MNAIVPRRVKPLGEIPIITELSMTQATIWAIALGLAVAYFRHGKAKP